MTVSNFANGTVTGTIGSEQFLSDVNIDGHFVAYIDTSSMATGIYTEFRTYKKVLAGGTALGLYFDSRQGPQPADDQVVSFPSVFNDLNETNAVRYSILQKNGTVVNYSWTINKEEESFNDIADGFLDRVNGIETGTTPRQAMRLVLSASVGKVSGAEVSHPIFRDTNDSKNRIDATTDANGNRTAVTLDSS